MDILLHSRNNKASKECCYCSSRTVKYGYTRGGNQRRKCQTCKRTQVIAYRYKAYHANTDKSIMLLTKEGLGIRSTARVLQISATTLLKRLQQIAAAIPRPVISKHKTYEVDELCTYVKKKSRQIWIVYALERTTKAVVSFAVGARTSKTLHIVTQTLLNAEAKAIHTDRLRQYATLIPDNIHHSKRFGTNHIERRNLSLRTHLKRLSRRSICYSKSPAILSAILKIYFWV